MRRIAVISLLLFGLAGCYSRTVEEKPVVVQPQPSHTVIVPPAGATVICPNGDRIPYGTTC